jgi:hypothetical protein
LFPSRVIKIAQLALDAYLAQRTTDIDLLKGI